MAVPPVTPKLKTPTAEAQAALQKKILEKKKSDLGTVEGLKAFAEQKGENVPVQKKVFNALDKISRVLNVGTATMAGAVRGAIRKDKTIPQGIKEGIEKNIGFGEILKEDLRVRPKTRAGKIAVGTLSLAADIVFDPLTYLTFGSSAELKLGERALSKTGKKLFQKLALEGGGKKGLANELIMQAVGKKGLTEEAFKKAAAAGIGQDTLESLARFSPKIIDKGGLKFAGRTIVNGDIISRVPGVSRIAGAVAGSERVQTFKNVFGELFVFEFGKNKKVQDILRGADLTKRKAAVGILEKNKEIFRGLGEEEAGEVFTTIFAKKKEVLETMGKLAEEGIEGARRAAKATQRGQVLTSANPKIQKVYDELFGTAGEEGVVKKFQRIAGVSAEDAFEFYIPSTFKGKKGETLFKTLSSPKMGFLKTFTGAETPELVRNPFAAFTKGQLDVVTAKIKGDAIRKVGNSFGRDFVDEATALSAGYLPFNKKTIEGEIKTYLPKEIHEELSKFISPQLKPIDKLAKASGFDWATSLFKGYVTALFPAFHIRNITSNGFLNMNKFGMAAFNPKTGLLAAEMAIGRGLDREIMAKTGKRFTLRTIKKMAEKQGILQEGAFGVSEQMIEDTAKSLVRGMKERTATKGAKAALKALGPRGILLETGRKVGSVAENQARLVGFITALMEGKTAKIAAKEVRQAVFDYSRLTEFEKKVMRRLIPFYSFTRFNAEAQLRTLLTIPRRPAGVVKGIRAAGSALGEDVTQEDLAGLPPYVLEGLGIKHGKDATGRPVFLTGFGLPIEEFLANFSGQGGVLTNLLQSALTKMNPIPKFAAERATGQDFFRERPIQEVTDAKDFKEILDVMPKDVKKQLVDFLEFREIPNQPVYSEGKIVGIRTKYTADPEKLHFLRNLPTSRLVGTIAAIAREETPTGQKALKALTGIKEEPIDIEEQKFFNDLAYNRELTNWLIRLGYIKEFRKPFEINPKKKIKIEAPTKQEESE